MIEKISKTLENKGIILKGTLRIELNENSNAAKIYDMHLTTFKKAFIGYWFIDTEQLVTL